jgi:formiminoglutamase
MSVTSSKREDWWSALEATPAQVYPAAGKKDDPRLGEVVNRWTAGPITLKKNQPVLIGFPCDEGVRRNGGRPGAALAPNAIREQLFRLTPARHVDSTDGEAYDLEDLELLDAGNVRVDAELEKGQERLGQVVRGVLAAKAVPIILGGGHETAFGHYLGYVGAGLKCAILNVDAHLDVRPYPEGGHSGSPFRQAMEHATHPLRPGGYAVFGAQRHYASSDHFDFIQAQGGRVDWLEFSDYTPVFLGKLVVELMQHQETRTPVMFSVDADAFRQADAPGVSAPSPLGLEGSLWPGIAQLAGTRPEVRSFELVEVNPAFDRDKQTVRWAAIGIRQFLVGLASRT